MGGGEEMTKGVQKLVNAKQENLPHKRYAGVPDSSKEIVSPGCDISILFSTVGCYEHWHLAGHISAGQQQDAVCYIIQVKLKQWLKTYAFLQENAYIHTCTSSFLFTTITA